MLVVTAREMRELDRLTIEKYGVSSLDLMERAGQSIASAILDRFANAAEKGVLVIAGKGNNGGDGFVVARLLKEKGFPSQVVLLGRKDQVSPDSAHNLQAFLQINGQVTEAGSAVQPILQKR